MDQPPSDRPIGRYVYIRYDDPADAFRPYDDRSPAVAARVASLIEAAAPWATVEHIGSTAIRGCDGKGVIDLMALYPPGRLVETRAAVDALGFQLQTNRPDPWPEERPCRLGSIVHDGEVFRIHCHVIAADDPEVTQQRHFRDTLRADPALVAAYVARKRAVLAVGARDAVDYGHGKDVFIRGVLGRAAR